MSLVTYALVTLDNAKDFLGITGSSKDTLLEMLINQATEYIEKYCNRRFAETTYTEQTYDGTKSKELQLKQFPIITFTLLQVNNSVDNTDNWDDVEADDYWVEDDTSIITKTTMFVTGKQNYRATYTAGYANIPYDLQLACLTLVSQALNKRKAGGVKSESLGDHSITFEDSLQRDGVLKSILANYRSIWI